MYKVQNKNKQNEICEAILRKSVGWMLFKSINKDSKRMYIDLECVSLPVFRPSTVKVRHQGKTGLLAPVLSSDNQEITAGGRQKTEGEAGTSHAPAAVTMPFPLSQYGTYSIWLLNLSTCVFQRVAR